MKIPEFGTAFITAVVEASKGNPVIALLTIAVLFIIFCYFGAQIETYFTGEPFFHVGDVISAGIFIYLEVYVVVGCAIYNNLNP